MKRYLGLILVVVATAAHAQVAILPNKSCGELVDLATVTAGHSEKSILADYQITTNTPVRELLGLSVAVQGCETNVHPDEQQQLREFRERLDQKYLHRLRAFLLAYGRIGGKSPLMDVYVRKFGRPVSEDQDRENMESFLHNEKLVEVFISFDEQHFSKHRE